ncbi:MAG: hypothetical protein ACREQM_13430 [Candidatus Dormibacteraceae bacterium]
MIDVSASWTQYLPDVVLELLRSGHGRFWPGQTQELNEVSEIDGPPAE